MKKLYTSMWILIFLFFSFHFAVAQTNTNPWIIKADKIDPSDYYGITVANGMIGIVSSPQPLTVKAVVLNGAYDLYGRGMVSNIMEVFDFLNMTLDVDGERVTAANISNMRQSLNMKKAVFTSSFDFKDKATVTYSYMALRQLPYTALVNVTIHAKKDITVIPASVMQAPDMLRDVQNYYNEIDRPQALIRLLTSTAKSPTGKLLIAASNCFIFPEKHGEEPQVIHEMWDNNMHSMKFYKHLKAGENYSFSVAGSILSSANDPDPLNSAERLTIYAALQGKDQLLNAHYAAWDSLWKSDIQIEGDPDAQLAVHSAMYHLYSFVRAGTAYSISPMGLSGLGYNGHIFWDADLWMFPAILELHPALAKSMIEYRYERLQAAERNAFSHGFKGAMYPWESAETGDEETPVWALSGPFEHHITADVAIAAWNYFCVTQDTPWLKEKGYPILKETADFWASRVQRNGPGHYDIDNVVAADEWAENVDNNAFTNAAAITNLRDAVKAAAIVGAAPDPDWTVVADNIPILKFPDGVTKEFAAYHGEPIKQADVNLLAYPLNFITDTAQIRKDLLYYEPRIGNGPAMSYSVLSLLYERSGNSEKAYSLFHRSYQPNEVPPFNVLAETAGGTNPYFATGAGGMLQAVLNGFGGLEITDHGIEQLKPKLPKAWNQLTITGVGKEKKTYVVRK
ncbi:MAG: glycoside hydrolase family 65 protein [Chitinophagaceae bacterium]|nr:MAG: glycoside hydrolase family 65 protein [Chitinophagaceae bacterium]